MSRCDDHPALCERVARIETHLEAMPVNVATAVMEKQDDRRKEMARRRKERAQAKKAEDPTPWLKIITLCLVILAAGASIAPRLIALLPFLH